MPVPLIAAGVAAVGSIGGALISSSGQKSAAKQAAAAQTQATDSQLQLGRENIAFQQGIYDQNKALLSPFVSRGNVAGDSINALLGLNGQSAPPAAANVNSGNYQTSPIAAQEPLNAMSGGYAYGGGVTGDGPRFLLQDAAGGEAPGYTGFGQALRAYNSPSPTIQQQYAAQPQVVPQAAPQAANGTSANDAFNNFANSAGMEFQLKQGENAINNNYAAREQIQSGAAMKALQNYGQSTALNNYFLPYLGLLQGQQATGAQSGAAIAGVGSNFGNTVSNIYGQQGNAIQNGADATSNAALLRGQANANFGNTVGSALGTFGSSFFQPNYGGGFNSSAYLNTPSPVSVGGQQPLSSVPVNWGSY